MKFSIVAAASLVAIAAALPQFEVDTPKCPSAPCADYIGILEYCADKEYEVYDIDWEYTDEKAVDCVCSTEALGKAADWSGYNATNVCYNCGDYEKETTEYDLMYNWLVTCKTWGWVDEEAAMECWNNKLEKGCWEPEDSEPYKVKARDANKAWRA